MTNAAQIAQLFDDLKPAFSLVDYEEVGLPVYKLTATVLTLESKKYSPIDEFVLRSIDAGMIIADDVAGLLGIETRIVEGCLTNLIQDDDVFVSPTGDLSLTKKSRLVLEGEKPVKPREQAVVFTYDALTRRPRYIGLPLIGPRDLKAMGFREIRAMPPRKPEADEVDARDLEEALEMEAGTRKRDVDILRVREVRRKENHFLRAVMLIYRSGVGDDVRVRFAVDGRLSAEHEKSFLAAGGVERLGIRDSILDSEPIPPLVDLIGEQLVTEISGHLSPDEDAVKLKRKSSIARFKVETAKKGAVSEADLDKDLSYLAAISEVETAERELASLKVRPIAVYEHPPLLEDALESAEKRVLIISPWITSAVVDKRFLKRLEVALERGVDVRIGYGLDDNRRGGRPEPNAAEKALYDLAKKHSRLKVVWLGNTHAKILLKDSEWFVVSSFNWLSFRGDPRRTFREEWGTFVGVSSAVDKYFAEFAPRFEMTGARG
ncbi:MAG: phospholipase D-like domain-containing protein [Rhodospirillales bacterium]|nr:phospholipase D-like domain-containing protein [Rhodospirillales bacterium]